MEEHPPAILVVLTGVSFAGYESAVRSPRASELIRRGLRESFSSERRITVSTHSTPIWAARRVR
jgi:hypothetical protein